MPKTALISQVFDFYNRIVEIVSILVLVFVTITVFVSVVSRYIFTTPLEWSEEISRYAFIWVVFLGFAIAEKSGDHFRIEYFANKFPIKFRIVLEVFLNVLIFGALYLLLLQGIQYFNQGKSGISTVVQMPLNYIYIALPVSVVLMMLNRVNTFIRTLKELLRKLRENSASDVPAPLAR